MTQTVKHLPVVRETWIRSLCREDPLEKEMATHSSTLAWKIPWTEEPGRLQSIGVAKSWTQLSDFTGHRSCQKYSCREKNLHAIHENFKLLLTTGKFYFFLRKSQLFIYYFSGHSFISF